MCTQQLFGFEPEVGGEKMHNVLNYLCTGKSLGLYQEMPKMDMIAVCSMFSEMK